jgi:hypothetical protein
LEIIVHGNPDNNLDSPCLFFKLVINDAVNIETK